MVKTLPKGTLKGKAWLTIGTMQVLENGEFMAQEFNEIKI